MATIMKIDSKKIRDERKQRAWSQEHLAKITDLGVRTIQRIESSGQAGNESVQALSAAFGVPINMLLIQQTSFSFVERLYARRFWIYLAIPFITTLSTPPQLTAQLVIFSTLLFGFEISVIVLRKRLQSNRI